LVCPKQYLNIAINFIQNIPDGEIMQNKNLSQKLEDILGLDTPPIAVKIMKSEEPLPDIKLPTQNSRYCQLLMLAKKGQTLMLNIS
jgi:uncharacterized protein (DUF169 family)